MRRQAYDKTRQRLVAVDPRYFRPTEVETLLGDSSKARTRFGWKPRIGFEELVKEMVERGPESRRARRPVTRTATMPSTSTNPDRSSRRMRHSWKDSRIFVAGHRGLVGSAIIASCNRLGFQQSAVAHPGRTRPDRRDRRRRASSPR